MKMLSNNPWSGAQTALHEKGFAHIPSVLSDVQCVQIKNFYSQKELFRSTINMQRYRFGVGEYKYFDYPLKPLIQSLRESLYASLAPIANDWMALLAVDNQYPADLQDFLSMCAEREQKRPTPLILRYENGGYNTLHQDMYGEVFFPFQVVFMLSQPGVDYEGGELVFVEQLPRAQSRAHVVRPLKGDAVIFTTHFRPVMGTKGHYRAKMKHGVSTVHSGTRFTMGLIFHDAN